MLKDIIISGIIFYMIISDTRVSNNCHTSKLLPLIKVMLEVKASEGSGSWIQRNHFCEITKGIGLKNQLSNLNVVKKSNY